MSTRDRLTLAAAAATALASSALLPLYADLGWLVRVLGGIAAVATAAALARAVGVPRFLQPLAALAGLLLFVVVTFAGSTLRLLVVPSAETWALLRATVTSGLLDVEELGAPVPTRPGLVLLAVLGVGAIAVAVDLVAVVLRRVAAAGVPLLLLFAVPAAVLPDGLGFVPFVLGALGWLGLLVVDGSDRVARWGTPLQTAAMRRSAGGTLGRTGRRIGAAALGVAIVVPLLLPGLDNRLLRGEGGSGGGGDARSTTTYNPLTRLAGQLRLPEPQTLLTYRTQTVPEYMRLTTLDVFDEKSGWSSSELAGDVREDAVQKGIPLPPGQTRTETRLAVTEISVTSRLDGPWLPVPFPPSRVDIPGPWIWDAEAQTVFSTRTKVGRVSSPYVVRATPLEPTPAELRAASAAPDEILKVYGQPPTVSDYTSELVARTTAGLSSDYDRVVALQQLFRDPANGFRYDTEASAPGVNSKDALENFLRGRVGFCEQYASAMAAMARSLAIPARVAVGFLPGRRLSDGSYEITTSEAHAWPEVWFGGAGWVRFEPTPRSDQVNIPDYSNPPAPELDGPDAGAAPAAPAGPEGAGAGADGAEEERADEAAGLAAGGSGDNGRSPVPLVLLGSLALMLLPALVTLVRRRTRLQAATAASAWDVVRDDALDVGHRWRPAHSPRRAAEHLITYRALPGPAQAALRRLAADAERARFARPADSVRIDLGASHGRVREGAADGGSALRRDVATVRRALLAGVRGGARMRALLLPASTARWAGSTVLAANERLQDRLDAGRAAAREQVRSRVPRRQTG